MPKAYGLDDVVAPLAARLFCCKVHPNVITASTVPLTLALFYVLTCSKSNVYALLIVLAVFRAFLDTADGAVARQCGLTSQAGAVFDIASDTLFVLGLTCIAGWATWQRRHTASVLGLLASLVTLGFCIKQIVFSAKVNTHTTPKSVFEKVLASNSIITSTVAVVWIKLMVDIARGVW